jgi:hypothetical protein
MKKIIVLSFILAAMILLGMNVNSSVRINNVSRPNSDMYIHYQVTVHPDMKITHNSCPLMVVITDGYNVTIGPPQLYHSDMNTYYFYELGPVTGVRKAKLTNVEGYQPDDVCYQISSTDAKSGTFLNGWNYPFDLYGSVKEIIKPGNSQENQ